MNASSLITKTEFFGNSDYAKSLRAAYNNNYEAYYSKNAPMLFENPLKTNHENYINEKRAQYFQALNKKSKAQNVWNRYKNGYQSNLLLIRNQNLGSSITSSQREMALNGAGVGASAALSNYNKANFEAEYAFSLLNDAVNSSINFLS